MTIKRVGPLLVAVAVATIAAHSAGAKPKPAPPPGQWAPGATFGYTETQTDLRGNVVATHAQDGLPATAGTTISGGGSDPAAVTAGAPVPLACCSGSGCDTVTPYVTKRDIFGIVMWRYGHTVHWCWGSPHITQLDVYGHFWDVDGSSSVVNYSNNGYGYYYTWAGSGNGGHFSDRQGSVSNCVFHYGCFGTSYPEIQVWINANGAWTSRVVDTG